MIDGRRVGAKTWPPSQCASKRMARTIFILKTGSKEKHLSLSLLLPSSYFKSTLSRASTFIKLGRGPNKAHHCRSRFLHP